MGSMDRIWQIGLVVQDVEKAKQELSGPYALTWIDEERTIDVVHNGERKEIPLRYSISREGPVHVELIEGVEGSPWWPPHGLDHIGLWADDLIVRASDLETSGWERQATYFSTSGAPLGFTYHRGPSGLRVEQVDDDRRQITTEWLAGGAPSLRMTVAE